MIQVIALQRQRYEGKWIPEGEQFAIKDEELSDMEGIRPPLVRVAPAQARQSYETRTMEAPEATKVAEVKPQVNHGKDKGKYDRRDLRAR